MHLAKKGAIAAIGAIGGSTVLLGMAASPAFGATITTPSPYAVPQSSPGVPNEAAISVNVTGLTAGTTWSAMVCDGVPFTTTGWSQSADCGPASAAQTVPSSGNLTFGGTGNFNIILWHGSTEPTYGEQNFNCLAPDDNPNGTLTAEGNLPIDPSIPAWGSNQGGNAANSIGVPATTPATTPCQIRIAESVTTASTADLSLPINLTASAATPESPLTIALPVSAAVILGVGAGFAVRRRRHRQAHAA